MTTLLLNVLVLICTLHSVSLYYYYDQYNSYENDYADYPLRQMNRRGVKYGRRAPFGQRPNRKMVHSNMKQIKSNPKNSRRRPVSPSHIIIHSLSNSKILRHGSGLKRNEKIRKITESSSTEVEYTQYRRHPPANRQNQAQIDMLNANPYEPGEYVPNQPDLQFGQGFPPTPALFNLNQPGMQFGPALSPLQSGLQYPEMQNSQGPPSLYNLNQPVSFAPEKQWLQNDQTQPDMQEIRYKNNMGMPIDPVANLDYYAQNAQNPNQPQEWFNPKQIQEQNIQNVPLQDNLNLSYIYNPIDMNLKSAQLVRQPQTKSLNLTRIEVKPDIHSNRSSFFYSLANLNGKNFVFNETQNMSSIEMTLNSTRSSVVSELPTQDQENILVYYGNNSDLPPLQNTTLLQGMPNSEPNNTEDYFTLTINDRDTTTNLTQVPTSTKSRNSKLKENKRLFSVFLENAFTYLASKPDQVAKLLIDQIEPAVTSWVKDMGVVAVVPAYVLKKVVELSQFLSTVPIEELKRIFNKIAETMKTRRKYVSSDLNAIIDLVDSMYNEQIHQINTAEDLQDLRDYPTIKRSAYALILDIINNIFLNPFLRSNQHQRNMLADYLNTYVLYYDYIRNNSFSEQYRNILAWSEGSINSFKQAAGSQGDLRQTVVNDNKSQISRVSVSKEDLRPGVLDLEPTTHRNIYPKIEENKQIEPKSKENRFEDIFRRKEFANLPTPGNLIITTKEPLNEEKSLLSYNNIISAILNYKNKVLDMSTNINKFSIIIATTNSQYSPKHDRTLVYSPEMTVYSSRTTTRLPYYMTSFSSVLPSKSI